MFFLLDRHATVFAWPFTQNRAIFHNQITLLNSNIFKFHSHSSRRDLIRILGNNITLCFF